MVRVESTLTFDAYLRVARAVLVRRFWMLGVVILGALPGTVLVALTAETDKQFNQSMIWLGFLIVVVLLIPFGIRRACRIEWDASPALRQPRVYKFDDTGIRWAAESFRGHTEWTLVQRVVTRGGCLLVYTGRMQFIAIPLSAIGPDQLSELEVLFGEHVAGFVGF